MHLKPLLLWVLVSPGCVEAMKIYANAMPMCPPLRPFGVQRWYRTLTPGGVTAFLHPGLTKLRPFGVLAQAICRFLPQAPINALIECFIRSASTRKAQATCRFLPQTTPKGQSMVNWGAEERSDDSPGIPDAIVAPRRGAAAYAPRAAYHSLHALYPTSCAAYHAPRKKYPRERKNYPRENSNYLRDNLFFPWDIFSPHK